MILVTGGTGFVGGRLVARLLQEGEQVRVLARSRVEVSSIELITGDVRDLAAVVRAARGCDAVIHLVGIIRERGNATFQRVHLQGTRTLVQACQETGVRRLLHMSALGTRPGARSAYHRSKWEAEQLVRASEVSATIFRPSVIFGPEGGFISEIRRLLHQGPVIPIIGDGAALLQPVWVEDVVTCFLRALSRPETIGHTYELGGPETYGFEQLVDLIAEAENINKPKVHLPVMLMRLAAAILGRLAPRFPITADQLTMLLEDNVCDLSSMREVFGVEPASLREHLAELTQMRPP